MWVVGERYLESVKRSMSASIGNGANTTAELYLVHRLDGLDDMIGHAKKFDTDSVFLASFAEKCDVRM